MKTKTIILLTVLIVSIGLIAVSLQGETVSPLDLEGFTVVSISVEPGVIHLTSECYRLSMVTTEFQTFSINTGLEGKIELRPTSHDLMKDILENFDIDVAMVKIDSFDQEIYFARLILKQEDRILNLDSKPSDAIAVAVRTGSPIYVKQSVLESNGERIC